MRKGKIVIVIFVVAVMFIIGSGLYVYRSFASISEMFRLNGELQTQGYYMGEFEFKMLGISYYLDKGKYYTALRRINKLHNQLKTTQGLIKVPEFNSKEEELHFYLDLQNPNTGAFMDESYPYCTYTGPTGNVLLHLDALAESIGQPLILKYPLKYLDEINTPQKLNAYLDDVSTVGRIAAKFPQTSFHFARDILSLYHEDDIVEKHNLYNVSPEIKQALLQWFYEKQDPKTGLWGPVSKSGKLMKKDLSNSISILKAFINKEGKDIHELYKLRYKNELAQTILDELFRPVPEDNELEEWHEWNLQTSKSINALISYLWNDISQENKEKAKNLIERYITIKFQKFYIPKEGAFSYYPYGEQATLDGTDGFFIFQKIGALSGEKQKQLWGEPEDNIIDLGIRKISHLQKSDFDLIANSKSVNSLRFYKTDPDYGYLTSGVFAVIYTKNPSVLDVMDLIPKIKDWINTTNQTMGNWVSKEEIIRELESIKLEEVPIYINDIPIESTRKILENNKKLVVIGFDILQVPRYKIVYEFDK